MPWQFLETAVCRLCVALPSASGLCTKQVRAEVNAALQQTSGGDTPSRAAVYASRTQMRLRGEWTVRHQVYSPKVIRHRATAACHSASWRSRLLQTVVADSMRARLGTYGVVKKWGRDRGERLARLGIAGAGATPREQPL